MSCGQLSFAEEKLSKFVSTTDTHLIPSDLALAIWSLMMPVNGVLIQANYLHAVVVIFSCKTMLYMLSSSSLVLIAPQFGIGPIHFIYFQLNLQKRACPQTSKG